jgi:uroporphyrinogen-III synthase
LLQQDGAMLDRLRAIAISQATAEALKPLVFAAVNVAPRPNLESLLNTLG